VSKPMVNTIKGTLWQLANSVRVFIKYKDIKMALSSEIACGIPENLAIRHSGLGIVIAKKVKIGKNVTIFQGVCLGSKMKKTRVEGSSNYGYPIIEDHVKIYGGSYVIGEIIIGHHSVIGCNSVVLKDVPPYAIVAGNPARIIGEVKK